ncbi:MAG: hypothetical protein KGS72_07665 [Cyanobacteria bacterium REEB67]|nr:hypothetical protein [Cyanobacteria bacterium REEB67]
MSTNLAALISLAVVFNGCFALSTQSVEAKTSQNVSPKARNYFVPPPPPYTPSMVPCELGIANAQAVTANADNAIVEKFVLSTQSFVAKTAQNHSRRGRNYFVPPPPPYAPSINPSALGLMNLQAVPADAYGKNISTSNQADMPQVVRSNPYLSYDRAVETKILKHIDSFDSEISSHEKEIGKLLNL